MKDEFPLIISECCQTCSILMLSGISALHPEPSPESLQQGAWHYLSVVQVLLSFAAPSNFHCDLPICERK